MGHNGSMRISDRRRMGEKNDGLSGACFGDFGTCVVSITGTRETLDGRLMNEFNFSGINSSFFAEGGVGWFFAGF